MPRTPHLLPSESLEEYNALSESLYAEFLPVTESERMMVDMLVHHQWFMRRALRMQHAVSAAAGEGAQPDPKRLGPLVRYYKTHERSFAQTKRQLESMRKFKRRMDTMAEKESAAVRSRQRQWEQLLKKMPPLTDWVN